MLPLVTNARFDEQESLNDQNDLIFRNLDNYYYKAREIVRLIVSICPSVIRTITLMLGLRLHVNHATTNMTYKEN